MGQEGIEYIRNLRDKNGLNRVGWLSGISNQPSDPCYFGNYCVIDSPNQVNPVVCPTPTDINSCPYVLQNTKGASPTYLYSQDASDSNNTATIFKRVIRLSQVIDNLGVNFSNEVLVTVFVQWKAGSATRQFIARENLFDWQ